MVIFDSYVHVYQRVIYHNISRIPGPIAPPLGIWTDHSPQF